MRRSKAKAPHSPPNLDVRLGRPLPSGCKLQGDGCGHPLPVPKSGEDDFDHVCFCCRGGGVVKSAFCVCAVCLFVFFGGGITSAKMSLSVSFLFFWEGEGWGVSEAQKKRVFSFNSLPEWIGQTKSKTGWLPLKWSKPKKV